MELLIRQHEYQLMKAMPWVLDYKRRLESLDQWWNKITLIGKINSYNIETMIFSDMGYTKNKLSDLQANLINNLVLEEVKKTILDTSSKAQVTIDILIRNLFERTADVGFLATDSDIRTFLKFSSNDESEQIRIQERLIEYVKKYSVYQDIIITDTQGNIKKQLDSSHNLTRTTDKLIEETINSQEEYVETYQYTDLNPTQKKSLIYSCKISETNDKNSPVLGVLLLVFKFEDEMKTIFEHLITTDSDRLLMLIEEDGTVIASNNDALVGKQKFKPCFQPQLVSINGKYYISITTKKKGYQGFYGLNWFSCSMIPMREAFNSTFIKAIETSDNLTQNILSNSSLFSSSLKQIHYNSKDVNEDLKLIVLNGIITAARAKAAEFVPVLMEIKKIGDATADIFGESILRLQDTVLSSKTTSTQFIAELAVGIMDRNLYERANDCRWWALTGAFRQCLGQVSLSESATTELSNILSYINNLYTVYTNLYLYNKRGEIVAVSNSDEVNMIGSYIESDSGSPEALELTDSQKYTVSKFVPTPYYGNKCTYIYNASITEVNNSSNVVGGIGIVFDSEPQFKAILTDTLPIDTKGNIISGCFGLFVSRNGDIISVTDYSPVQVGESLSINDPELLLLDNGSSFSKLLTYNKGQYIVGVAASSGYREFKTTGDYTNDVISLIFVPV
ncbi:MAG: cache domain-containing protein [Colwellia sp.]